MIPSRRGILYRFDVDWFRGLPDLMLFHSRSSRLLAHAAWVLLLCGIAGCRSFARQPIADNVVQSRQMALHAMEAMQHGRYDEAEQLFADSIKTCPVDERARCRYAELLWRRGQHDAALRQMQEAVRLSAGDPALRVQLGQMNLALGNTRQAQAEAERAVAADRRHAAAWCLLADTQRASGQYEEALASYHRALSIEPFYPHAQMSAAAVYRQLGRPQRALATLAALEDRYGPGQAPVELFVMQGAALKQLGRYDDAVRTLSTAVARGSELPDTYYELADAQILAGDRVSARLSVAAALEQNPTHEPSLRLRDALETPNIPRTATR